jgi:hypothetical protein
MIRRQWRRHSHIRTRWRMGDRRRRCRSWSRLRRLMNGLWCRDVFLRCRRRRLCRVWRWLRPLSRRRQMGEVGRARRMSCRCCRRGRWRRRVCCRYLRRRLPGFGRCRVSSWRRGARDDLHRLRHCMRPDLRWCQMREIRCAWSLAGHGCRQACTGAWLRCRGCRGRRLASSCGGRLRARRCCRGSLRGLRQGADARRWGEL